MTYTPKNNWYFNNVVNTCFTEEQFKELEDEYEFSNENIFINYLYCNAFGHFNYDFEFKGVKFSGVRKLHQEDQAVWSDENREWIEFQMCLELLSCDLMNDVYENHEQYK
jgi:hypothetical protein